MRIFTVDAFTAEPFKGNPAGVCVLDKELSDESYLKIASEINYAETAFLLKESNEYKLRWFTPKAEVDLCGHATLATAKILFDIYHADAKETLKFNTRSGELLVTKQGKLLEMNFPAAYISKIEQDEVISEFLNQEPVFIGVHKEWLLAELENEQAVKDLKPNLNLLNNHQQEVFIVTAKSSGKPYDFVSRVFAPAIGIDEDPVTGSAHCYLATYWSEKLAKKKLFALQASERSGEISCEVIENNRVLLKGEAVIMSELKVFWLNDIA